MKKLLLVLLVLMLAAPGAFGQKRALRVDSLKVQGKNVTTFFQKLDANNKATSAALGDTSVSTAKIKDLNVTEGKINTGAVTENKLGAYAVTDGKIANNTITSSKIVAGTIEQGDLADSLISLAKLTAASLAYIGSGGSVTNNPDDESIKNIGDNLYVANPFYKNTNITDGDATPSVDGYVCFRTANTSPTTITYFDSPPASGRKLCLLYINDVNTTIQHNSGLDCGGVDITPSAGDMFGLYWNGNKWLCYYLDPAKGSGIMKRGKDLYVVSTTDSFGIGTTDPEYPFHMNNKVFMYQYNASTRPNLKTYFDPVPHSPSSSYALHFDKDSTQINVNNISFDVEGVPYLEFGLDYAHRYLPFYNPVAGMDVWNLTKYGHTIQGPGVGVPVWSIGHMVDPGDSLWTAFCGVSADSMPVFVAAVEGDTCDAFSIRKTGNGYRAWMHWGINNSSNYDWRMGTNNGGDMMIFSAGGSTSCPTVPGTQVMTWEYGGQIGIGSTSPTAQLHIYTANGYDQLRLQTNYTPTSSADLNGSVGNICWDNSYIYVKCASGGWKRAALSAW